jgi:ankyrin repeat protein
MSSREIIKRVFTIKYKIKDFINIENDIDLFILGIANIKDNDGWASLTWASYRNNLKVVQALIQAEVDLNIQENNGRTALIWASRNDHLKIVQILIQAGVDVNIQGNDGYTALIWASYYNYLEVAQALIQAGADVNIKNNDSNSALNLTDNIEIKDLLKQAGTK